MLFFKECKKTICSLTFILYAAAVIFMYVTQFTTELNSPLMPPQPEGTYGSIVKEMPEVLMPAAIESLKEEYLAGSYTAYPFMLYKEVKLQESDSAKIAEILEELTGNDQVSYERFKELMAQADDIIGGGSKYSEQYLIGNFSTIPMSYEEALEEYEIVTDEKNIASSYIRLYCDYMGIILGIMPVFVCAVMWQADKRNRMEALIYSRKISSVKLVMTRYSAMVCVMFVPVALTLLHALIGVYGLYPEKNICFGKAAGLAVLWLFPEIMAVSATGVLVSELVSPFLAVFLQGIWWYMALEKNALTGSITKYTLVIRHNNLGKPLLFAEQLDNFIWNRTGYLVLSLIMAGMLVFLYDKIRKGEFRRGNQCKNKNLWKDSRREFKA